MSRAFARDRLAQLALFPRTDFSDRGLLDAPSLNYRALSDNLMRRGPQHIPGIVSALSDGCPHIRREAALAIYRSLWVEADPVRASLWSSDDATVSRVGVHALRTTRALCRAAERAELPSTRRHAVKRLASRLDDHVRAVLEERRLLDDNARVRRAADDALVRWMYARGLAPTRDILRDRPDLRALYELNDLRRSLEGAPADVRFDVLLRAVRWTPESARFAVRELARSPRFPPSRDWRCPHMRIASFLVRLGLPRPSELSPLARYFERDSCTRVGLRVLVFLPRLQQEAENVGRWLRLYGPKDASEELRALRRARLIDGKTLRSLDLT